MSVHLTRAVLCSRKGMFTRRLAARCQVSPSLSETRSRACMGTRQVQKTRMQLLSTTRKQMHTLLIILNTQTHERACACVRVRACLEAHSRGGRVSHDPLVFGELIVEKKRISPVHLAHVTSSCA